LFFVVVNYHVNFDRHHCHNKGCFNLFKLMSHESHPPLRSHYVLMMCIIWRLKNQIAFLKSISHSNNDLFTAHCNSWMVFHGFVLFFSFIAFSFNYEFNINYKVPSDLYFIEFGKSLNLPAVFFFYVKMEQRDVKKKII
jgi:hypothetical protein